MTVSRSDRPHHTGRIFRSALIFILSTCLILTFSPVIGSTSKVESGKAAGGKKEMSVEERWGVKFESLRSSSNGHIIDFRYRIKDPEKAVELVDRRNKAYLIDQTSGRVLAVPDTAKVGPLRQTVRAGKPKADKIYFVLFGNSGFIEPGDLVTVVIGDFRMENLVVE